jgi:hypothetical protein
MKDVKQKVKAILKDYPNARNDDGSLIAVYIAKHFKVSQQGEETFFNLKYMKDVPISTIRRCRRIIQNTEHKFLPTDPKVINRRKLAEVVFREKIRYNNSING